MPQFSWKHFPFATLIASGVVLAAMIHRAIDPSGVTDPVWFRGLPALIILVASAMCCAFVPWDYFKYRLEGGRFLSYATTAAASLITVWLCRVPMSDFLMFALIALAAGHLMNIAAISVFYLALWRHNSASA